MCFSPTYTETAASRGLLDSSLALSLLHVDMKSLQPHCRSRKRPFFGKGREDGELEEAIYFAKQISSRFSVPRISRPPAWRKRPPLAWRILTTSGAGFWGLGMFVTSFQGSILGTISKLESSSRMWWAWFKIPFYGWVEIFLLFLK